MKLSYLILALLAVGCAKTEPIDNGSTSTTNTDRIAFRSSTDMVTSENNFGLTDIYQGFNVIGVKNDGQYIDGFADPLDGNVTYQWNATATPIPAWEWQDGSLGAGKIWPDNSSQYPLTFFTAYPKTEELTATQTTPLTVYKTPTNIPTASTFYNLSPASGPYAVEANTAATDLLGAMTIAQTRPLSGFADFNFKHILSAMDFQIITAKDYKVFVQSIKIANVNGDGRVYDYKTAMWSAEPTYTASHNVSFCHSYVSSAEADNLAITGIDEDTPVSVAPIPDGNGGFYTLKLMPQTVVSPWACDIFSRDAAQWATSNASLTDIDAISAWYNSNADSTPSGMLDSKGWQGARIEVVYRVEDPTGRSVIGHKPGDIKGTGPGVWASAAYIRVGYPLDLANLANGAQKGWQPGYRYTYQIKLSTANSTNGILLDPDFKTADGENTEDKVDNPHTNPGEDITKSGTISFDVQVDEWANNGQTII